MPNQPPILVAEGDSWFALPDFKYLNSKTDNILEGLENRGYEVISVAESGETIEEMAFVDKQHEALKKILKKLNSKGKQPHAVLLSGGGNDLVDYLAALLNTRSNKACALHPQIVNILQERLVNSYSHLIELVRDACKQHWSEIDIPIIVHGYGHPVPDGRSHRYFDVKFAGPWLKPVFERKGYKDHRSDLKIATDVMKTLVDMFNDDVLLSLADKYKYVCYVDLRCLLSNQLNDKKLRHYKVFWDDELHPDEKVFKRIAKKIDKSIQGLNSK